MDENFCKIAVRTWTLLFRGEIPAPDTTIQLEPWLTPGVEEYLHMYRAVGENWGWTGRLLLSKNELEELLHSSSNEVWRFRMEGRLLGFFEIDRSVPDRAEIVYLGLLPEEIGKGYGSLLLSAAVRTASEDHSQVWLHTCEFDHSNALRFYLQRGFEVHTELIEEEYYPLEFLIKHKKSQS